MITTAPVGHAEEAGSDGLNIRWNGTEERRWRGKPNVALVVLLKGAAQVLALPFCTLALARAGFVDERVGILWSVGNRVIDSEDGKEEIVGGKVAKASRQRSPRERAVGARRRLRRCR